jgi:chaperonin GroES
VTTTVKPTLWQPSNDQVLVRPCIPSDRTAFGLILPENAKERERPLKGIVVSKGPGLLNPESGVLVPVQAQIGDLVAFGLYAGLEWKDRGETFLLVRDCEILLRSTTGDHELVEHQLERAQGTQTVIHEAEERCEHCPKEVSEVITSERKRIVAAKK